MELSLIIFFICSVLLILTFFQFKKAKEKSNQFISENISFVQSGLDSWKRLTSFEKGYFSNYDLQLWNKENKWLRDKLQVNKPSFSRFNNELSKPLNIFLEIYSKADAKRTTYNESFIKNELIQFNNLFNDIEGRKLDVQQRTAIVTDEDNNLVIAGAGTGKTTTIAGKVAYIIQRYKILPEEILLISFTTKACEEMQRRIKVKMGINLEVKTFHKLGLDIIADTRPNKEKPNVFSLSKQETDEIFNNIFKKLLEDNEYLNLVTLYFTHYLKPYKDENDFKSDGERMQYLKDQNLFGLKQVNKDGIKYRERLKSQQEVEIANFLFLNGIDYTYEEWYEFKTASKNFGQYKPDFKINTKLNEDGKGIYIEHFGIDKMGNVPNWFKGEGNQTATEKYNAASHWKRTLHQEKGTTLIETYSHEGSDGKLISNLKEKLKKHGIEIHPRTPEEIWKVIEANANEDISSFIQLIQTFLSLQKSNNYKIEEIKNKIKLIEKSDGRERAFAFMEIYEPIKNRYEKMLLGKQIDFNDMINEATSHIKAGRYEKQYKYILIDEFQDISIGRYGLIKAIKDNNPYCKLFCVGDDWQSIYRFSGSDIAIFTEFEKYFGETSKSYIEKTYRFNNKLIEVSSEFILKNPKQLSKGLKSERQGKEIPFTIIPYNFSLINISIPIKRAIEDIIERCNKNIEAIEILLLGRYNHEINALEKNPELFSFKWIQHEKRTVVIYKPYPKVKISFMSVHAAKGLEADYVILLNGNSGKYAFPSEISDDPLLNLVLTDADQFPNGEERRLFYVALTRTKNHLFIISKEGFKSKFVVELEDKDKVDTSEKCPWCETGRLILRDGPYSPFYGCSNYPHYCNYTRKVDGKEIFKLAEIEVEENNYDAAIELYKKAIQAGNFPKNIYFCLGVSEYLANKYGDSVVSFKKYIRSDSNSFNANKYAGMACYKLEKYQEANDFFNAAIKLKSDAIDLFYFRGVSLAFLFKNKEAILDFNFILERNPNDQPALIARGEAHYNMKNLSKCWKDWKLAERLGSSIVQSYFENYNLLKEPVITKLNQKIANSDLEKKRGIELAISSEFLIKFHYQNSQSFYDGEESLRTIKPIEIVNVGVTNSACVKGYCLMRKEDRTFAIERVSELIIDPEQIEFWDRKQ